MQYSTDYLVDIISSLFSRMCQKQIKEKIGQDKNIKRNLEHFKLCK